MKICLATLHAKPLFMPLALLYLKAFLVDRQHRDSRDVEILEFTRDSSEDSMVRQILATEPEVLGLSCYVWNITALMAVAGHVRRLRPQVTIVLGGPEVGPIGRSVLERYPSVDIVVKSEGEVPFAEIVSRLSTGGDVASIAGIVCRDGSLVVETEDAPILGDLNQLASPHRPEFADYKGRIVCIETQRGCVFRCNFCFYNKDLSIRNRRFDLNRVKREILFWLERDVNEIYLMDPVFNLNADRAKQICRFIVNNNHRQIKFHAEVWAEFIDEELARLLRDAHFEFLEVGLQTTDDTTLATVDRRLKLQRFIEGTQYLKQYRLKYELQLIHGLPGETPASFRKSLDFAGSIDPPSLTVFTLMVLPGTDLWRKAGVLSLDFDPEPPYFVRSHYSMSSSDIVAGRKVVAAVGKLGDSRTIRFLCKEPNVTLSEVMDAWVAWHDGQTESDLFGEKVQRFIVHFCAVKQIPTEFYRGFASLEFRVERPARSESRSADGTFRGAGQVAEGEGDTSFRGHDAPATCADEGVPEGL